MTLTREALCRVWLAMSDSATVRARKKLLERYGSAEAAFDCFSSVDRDCIGPAAWEEYHALKEKGLDRLSEELQSSGHQIAFREDAGYPPLLRQIDEAPNLLFFKGSLETVGERAVAIVGSRRETRYGREQAYRIAKELALSQVTVVSGLARGIDTAAHRGALDGKGRTIAVLGSGLSRIYPAENAALAERIALSGGAVVSELPPMSEPLAFHFPIRNRIVSGLSHAVLLVEAREKSGTLITVGHALDQGREVFALPGQVDSAASQVPNRFIREGARLCTCAEDILEDLGWADAHRAPAKGRSRPRPTGLSAEQMKIYHALQEEEKSFSELLEATSLPVSDLGIQITLLEMEDVIETLPGRQYRLRG